MFDCKNLEIEIEKNIKELLQSEATAADSIAKYIYAKVANSKLSDTIFHMMYYNILKHYLDNKLFGGKQEAIVKETIKIMEQHHNLSGIRINRSEPVMIYKKEAAPIMSNS